MKLTEKQKEFERRIHKLCKIITECHQEWLDGKRTEKAMEDKISDNTTIFLNFVTSQNKRWWRSQGKATLPTKA